MKWSEISLYDVIQSCFSFPLCLVNPLFGMSIPLLFRVLSLYFPSRSDRVAHPFISLFIEWDFALSTVYKMCFHIWSRFQWQAIRWKRQRLYCTRLSRNLQQQKNIIDILFYILYNSKIKIFQMKKAKENRSWNRKCKDAFSVDSFQCQVNLWCLPFFTTLRLQNVCNNYCQFYVAATAADIL